jgi:hypothetical protein
VEAQQDASRFKRQSKNPHDNTLKPHEYFIAQMRDQKVTMKYTGHYKNSDFHPVTQE